MFGYLKYEHKKKVKNNIYYYHYCGLCNALKKNYGTLTMITLNNDVAFLSLVLSTCINNFFYEPSMCCMIKRKNKIKEVYSCEYWKRLSAFSLSLAYAKSYDNVLDSNKIVEKIHFAIVKFITRKAKKENNELFIYMRSSMNMLKKMENEKCGLKEQSKMFSETVSHAIDKFVLKDEIVLDVSSKETSLRLVKAIVQWICFVDSIDDYDDDMKNNNYNPLYYELEKSNCWNENSFKFVKTLFEYRWKEILFLYQNIRKDLYKALAKYNFGNENAKKIIYDMVYIHMPQKVYDILRRQLNEEL